MKIYRDIGKIYKNNENYDFNESLQFGRGWKFNLESSSICSFYFKRNFKSGYFLFPSIKIVYNDIVKIVKTIPYYSTYEFA